MNNRQKNGGFTLVEFLVVVLIVGVLLAVQLVFIGENRKQASVRADVAKFRLIGQASAMYAEDNQDRLFAFSWRPGEVPDTPNTDLAIACAQLGNSASSFTRAAVFQQLDLVTRGFEHELLPADPSVAPTNHTPYPQFNHLILAHYMGEGLPSETFISSKDRRRNYWREHMDKYLDNPVGGVYRPPTASTNFNQLWKWPFSSSFMVGVSHYSNDTGNVGSVPSTPRTAERASTNRSWRMPTVAGVLGNRLMSEVTHPSLKVMMFDEYDRSKGQYFGLETSASTMVFYDGSAGRFSTASANYGFQPNDPDRGADMPDQPSTFYFYSPISWWDPPGAIRSMVPVYYDQTRNGLQGIDYSPGSVRRPIRGQFGQ